MDGRIYKRVSDMTICICQHEERHHEAGKCDRIGCHCELFRPDMEDYTDIKFGPIDTATEREMMTTNNVYDHATVQHGFVRKALRYAGDEADLDEREQLEQELPEYAATIIEAGGYDLDQRIAALQAENARLRASLRPFAEYAATLTNWDSDPIIVAKWSGILVTVGDFRKAALALESP